MSDINQIKSLREETGLSVIDIKKALAEAGGDAAKARKLLSVRGGDVAAKKAGRELKDGIIESYVHNNKHSACMLELLCETDFVSRNADFQNLAHDLALHITAMKPQTNEELLDQPFIKNPDQTIRDLLISYVAKLGENIQIGRFEIFTI
ncbi:MAG: Elongation factor Ts [Parcubacteria group bacterium GW2011_GWA1_49_11]|uniref:Elongation factor Ts n=1 Tax=Candidatus Yanofskybacteria bacterium RIFCSPHIGHO2_01_FULL_48_25b TaxID=1802672 RepID=A0A1F8F2X7_9BACT|nr:MAG: Elongation factor Ts [Parcubacteria group bacterium GW2011_GWA1_49_11]OGN07491.1 MAG: translation elongation factor Ts [Candidatus Yanofskybacteria bacterium RIFCSPHIGHO2_01_FULL_48_25b]